MVQPDVTRGSPRRAETNVASWHPPFEACDTELHRAIASAVHHQLLLTMFGVMNTARTLPVRQRVAHPWHILTGTAAELRDQLAIPAAAGWDEFAIQLVPDTRTRSNGGARFDLTPA